MTEQKQNKYIADKVLLVEPVSFGFNQETAVNNFFQSQSSPLTAEEIQGRALKEFYGLRDALTEKGIEVITIKDTEQPRTPDAVFPNNWISFHEDGQIVLYPMFAPNRRMERRQDITKILAKHHIQINNIVDFTFWETENRFLEGTGSMVLDRRRKIAYAALSDRTDKSAFLQYCCTFGYEPIIFEAFQSVNGERKPVYHTNVMLCVADTYAVICSESIDDERDRDTVLNALRNSGKKIIDITEEQMHGFAGNMLQLSNQAGQRFLVMSQQAYDVLTINQREELKQINELIVCAVPTIESIGGGSVRCMIAEIFTC